MTTEERRRSGFADRIVVSRSLAELKQGLRLAPGQAGSPPRVTHLRFYDKRSAPALFRACGWRSWVGRALGVAESAAKTEMSPAAEGWEARANHSQGFGGSSRRGRRWTR